MKIIIKLIGPLIYAAGFSEKEMEVPQAVTSERLLELVGIGPDRPRIVTRNGKAVGPAEAFAEGDRIVISPLYSGG
jgi:sulfur carrier protein ThiS